MRNGDLPQGWTWTTVTELGAPSQQAVLTGPFGASLGRDDFVSVGVPVLTIGCLTEAGLSLSKAMYTTAEKALELDRYQVQVGDVLFSRMASVGRADVVTAAFAGTLINYHLMRLRLAPEVIVPSYFVYFVRGSNAVTDYVHEVNHGATRDGINTNQLLAMPVLLPPLAEQSRIVAAIEEQFTRLDAGVAALKRAQAALKRYRAAVLKAAVEGKLTAAWRSQHPDVRPASELLADILAERRARWEADLCAKGKDPAKAKYEEPQLPQTEGLPALPQGWVWATLDQVSQRIVDCAHSTARFRPQGYLCIDTNCILPGSIVFDSVRYVDAPTYAERISRMKPEADDVMFSREGTIGIAVRVPPGLELCLGQRMMIFRTPASVDSGYLESVLNSTVVRDQCSRVVMGTTAPHINIRDIRQFMVPLPPTDEQRQIAIEAEQRLSVIAFLEATVAVNLKRAERLRQAILERAFTGRLVPQDPADEPASALLERMRTEQESNRRPERAGRRIGAAGGAQPPPETAQPVTRLAQNPLW